MFSVGATAASLPDWKAPILCSSDHSESLRLSVGRRGNRAYGRFLTDIAPAPARQPALADFDPATGRARLSYRRAAETFTTASGGWTLHQPRHFRLTHLAEAGAGLPMLMTKSRHRRGHICHRGALQSGGTRPVTRPAVRPRAGRCSLRTPSTTRRSMCCPSTWTRPSLASLAIYAKPTFDAVAAATAALDPDRRR